MSCHLFILLILDSYYIFLRDPTHVQKALERFERIQSVEKDEGHLMIDDKVDVCPFVSLSFFLTHRWDQEERKKNTHTTLEKKQGGRPVLDALVHPFRDLIHNEWRYEVTPQEFVRDYWNDVGYALEDPIQCLARFPEYFDFPVYDGEVYFQVRSPSAQNDIECFFFASSQKHSVSESRQEICPI